MNWLFTSVIVSALILLGIHGAAYLRVSKIEGGAAAEGQFADIAGQRIHAVVQGKGRDLVLIHGASGSARDFTFGLLADLAKTYRVFAIDRPGFGWSQPFADSSGGSLSAQAKILSDAASKLGATRPIVVGHSYGGAVALAWALEQPDRLSGLVTLSAPMHLWDGEPPLFHRLTQSWFGRIALNPMIAAFVPKSYVYGQIASVFAPQSEPEGYAQHFDPMMSVRPITLFANARQRVTLKEEIRAMIPRYVGIAVPVEMIHGTADRTVWLGLHAEKVAPLIEGANLTVLEGIGHMPHHSAADDIIDVIARRFPQPRL